MGGVLPTESNISMVGVGLLGRTTSGAGKSGRMSQASVLSWLGLSASGVTDGKALIASSNSLAWSPSAAALLPDTLPAAGTLLSYGGSRQLAAGGTVSHSGALSITGAVTASGKFTNAVGTITADTPATITQTWNNSGVTFTGLLTNVTDTSSASYSLLMDLQSSGSSIFSVRRAYIGGTKYNRAVVWTPQYSYITQANGGFVAFGTNETTVNVAVDVGVGSGIRMASGSCVAHVNDSSNVPSGSVDLAYGRDSAGVLGIYTSTAKTIKGSLACGAITASGDITGGSYFRFSNASSQFFRALSTWVAVSTHGGYGLAMQRVGIANTANTGVSPTLCLDQVSTTFLEINNGTIGTLRDLSCRDVVASGDITGGSYFRFSNASSQFFRALSTWVAVSTYGGYGLAMQRVGIANMANTGASPTLCLDQVSTTFLEINNGTIGTLRDLSCRDVVASGAVMETPTQSSINPTTVNIPSGQRRGWYNSTLAEFRDWVNIGGTLLKSAAYT